ncbi:hypothetical protein G3480_15100 [Thiorhodococcus mannitoliphagus]|uniref:Uncharacterized protein n=1 Tax=Thiorhodococcus mannitoliphagus TaxID=329406 RepID=A0A6P1DVV7_9GAMM|nr:hypothetical protein [Thiorhodococcus mannitoliphagus]NEX21620.1 hypothetical protein [Thiorhodococcus mannitoliphagus]
MSWFRSYWLRLLAGLLGTTLLMSASLVIGAEWSGTLQDGSRVEVDPSTHRAWRTDGQQRAPLWDGVHRLDDGSVVIVQGGRAVQSQGMLEAWDPASPVSVLPQTSACYELVDRVCGLDFRCSLSDPCRLANDLVDMAKAALTAKSTSQLDGGVEAQCREALTNDFFVPCE